MPSDREQLKEILEAGQAWVRAEYEFRAGLRAFQNETADWYVMAEVRLRRALTGKGQLENAFVAVGGVPITTEDRKKKR